MTTQIDGRTILNSLPEPALVVTLNGEIETANRAAITAAGRPLAGTRLGDAVAEDEAKLDEFLLQCSGCASPVMGSLNLLDASGSARKYRCYGNAFLADGRKLIFIRLNDLAEDRFSILTERVSKLNAEIRRHLHTQAALRESLRERELLIREMHHRVKNNIQMLHGMLSTAAQETVQPEARRKLEDSARRLAAIGTVQQALYTSTELTKYRADHFIDELVRHLKAAWPEPVNIEAVADPLQLPNEIASSLALIINELVTNALKHGVQGQTDATVSVRLVEREGQVELSVADPGPGFEPSEIGGRSSGLGLVRGLVRQLGGSFKVLYDKGVRCVVQFRAHQMNG